MTSLTSVQTLAATAVVCAAYPQQDQGNALFRVSDLPKTILGLAVAKRLTHQIESLLGAQQLPLQFGVMDLPDRRKAGLAEISAFASSGALKLDNAAAQHLREFSTGFGLTLPFPVTNATA